MDSIIKTAFSYDDVLLVPQYSEVESREDVDLTTKLTPDITLKIPLVSANMSDVTGVDMAIKIGKLGGLGIIPRFMTDDEQATKIVEVKKQKVLVGAAIGVRNGMFERSEKLLKAGADILVLDVAHGFMKKNHRRSFIV